MRRLLIASIAALLLALGGPAFAIPINPAVTYTSSSMLHDSRPFTLGFQFTLSNPVTVNGLGYWVDGQPNAHQVGIWDSSRNLVVSVTVLHSDPVVDHFNWHSVPDTVLGPGAYNIGGEFLGNNNNFPYLATGITTISGYTWTGDALGNGGGLFDPVVSTGDVYGDNGILLANFSVVSTSVPEPATLALMGVALLGFAAFRRRKST